MTTGLNRVARRTDSLAKRYAFKLLANLAGLFISFGTQVILPRGLGPKGYGDYNFLSNFFSQVLGFFDMGTSIGFFTKLSSRPRESALVTFYLYFSGAVYAVTPVLVFLISATVGTEDLWPEQGGDYIYLAMGLALLTWSGTVVTSMADAYGITVAAESARTAQKGIGLFILFILFRNNWLDLASFFYYSQAMALLLIIALLYAIRRNGHLLIERWRLSREELRGYLGEFYDYSHPLLVYALAGMIVAIFDRWLLQMYGGSIEQGYFGLSYQIGAFCFLFTSAMTPLLTREFSIAFGSHDLQRMGALFRRHIPLLYSVAAYFSCFIALQAEKVTQIMGGKGYESAVPVVAIMAFYPLHQTYGQLSGSVFYATGQTRVYRNIGIFFMVLGVPITYLLIAPSASHGLESGAIGLALKMVAIQVVAVNVQLYYNTRFLRISFGRMFGHQVLSVASLLVVSAGALLCTDRLLGLTDRMLTGFLVAGVIYSVVVVALAWLLPALFGLDRGDIELLLQALRGLNPSKRGSYNDH